MANKPPITARRLTTTVRHGETDEDPYAWLKDENWQAAMRDPGLLDPEIRAHLEAENAFTADCLAPVETLRKTLVAEMRARIKEDDSTVPTPDGPYCYYRRFAEGGEHPVFCRTGDAETASEEVLLDGNREAEGHAFFRVGECSHSPDHRLAAYALDLNGSEYYTVHLRDMGSGAVLEDRIASTQGDIVWANDSRTFFYTILDENHRPSKVYRHVLGQDPAEDALVYHETDPAFFLDLDKTESRRFITITAHGHSLTSEVHLVDADAPEAPPSLVAPREMGIEFEVRDHGDRFLILTNADDAEDFKIAQAPLSSPGRENWRDLVGHQRGRLIRRLVLFRSHMVRLERIEGTPHIVITRLDDGEEHEIAFDEEAFELGVMPGYEFDSTILRFTYSSLTTPRRVYDYDMAARTRVLRKEDEVPSGHDPAAYVSRRVFATGHDGAQIPISLVHKKTTPLDGKAPLLLYGYGSYGHAILASFAPNRFSLIDRGFVYAIAHIRGGTERGYRWYLDGKLGHKPNTFLDFTAAAEHLIAEGFTAKGAIAAHGASAGGMLMGAVANMRPELFRAIVAEVPFVDVLNTMSDATLPLTPPEWTEWGNPIEDAVACRMMRSYSPYDNVRAQPYPHILATGGLTDPRVTYWEPAKWVARLRALKTDGNLALLRINMEAGHGGAAGRFERLEEVALVYAFVLMAFGMAEVTDGRDDGRMG